ncbi:MAG: polysaccharide deacetylase family protein [Akkermansia sp.]|nr:polysaccharide deacetylase family protein [Akkermansia sp.]
MRFDIIGYVVCGILLCGLISCQQQQGEQEVPAPVSGPSVVKKGNSKGSSSKTSNAQRVASERAAAAKIVPRRPGLRVSRVQAPGMYVALTFDDGPSSAYTPKVLDILKRHGARGTFFVLGSNVNRFPSIVKRAAAEGHEIGVHTWSHINMARSSMPKIDSEVSRCVEKIRSVTGKAPVVMRPPYGATTANIVNHMFTTYGMRSILWDVDTRDWQRPGVSTVVNRAVNGAKPGSIILVHDIHASTLAAVEGIVTGLQARGFQLVTVSELMARAGVVATPRVAEPTSQNTPEQPVQAPVVGESVAPAAEETPVQEVAPADTVTPVAEPQTLPASPAVPAETLEPERSSDAESENDLQLAA